MSKEADNIIGDQPNRAVLPEQQRVHVYEAPPSKPAATASSAHSITAPADSVGSGEREIAGKARGGLFERIAEFVQEVRAEMQRVSWPTATEVKNTTIITLVAVIFFAIYLYAVDQSLAFLITQIEHLANWLFGAV